MKYCNQPRRQSAVVKLFGRLELGKPVARFERGRPIAANAEEKKTHFENDPLAAFSSRLPAAQIRCAIAASTWYRNGWQMDLTQSGSAAHTVRTAVAHPSAAFH